MSLPPNLQAAIENELAGISQEALSKAVEGLTNRYRDSKPHKQFMVSEVDRKAYMAYRMPATYAVNCRVFSEIRSLTPEWTPQSIVDLGSGPGTALWAARDTLETIESFTAIEGDPQLIQMAKRLASLSGEPTLQSTKWHHQDLCQLDLCPKADIVVASYAIGELSENEQMKLLSKAWQAAGQALVLIEPGTPPGFKRILAWRSKLIEAKAFLLAPCPHAEACPMSGSDWCHFSQRLSRSSLHRQLKGAALGHEDEKFSYLIAVKQPVDSRPNARILRHPQKHSGHIEMILCTAEGLKKQIFSRKDGEAYKQARKLDWGDALK